jgi:hypothetical protein
VQSGIPDGARRASAELLGRGAALEPVRLTSRRRCARARADDARDARIVSALDHPHIVSIFEGRHWYP